MANKSGGVALDVGFTHARTGKSKPLPKGLSERLSQRAQKAKDKRVELEEKHKQMKQERQGAAGKKKPARRTNDGSRAPMKVNPVTGEMIEVETSGNSNQDDGMVREGCMNIPKKYLTAAVDAGLGSSNGMYSHVGVLRRELNSGHNLGHAPRNGQSPKVGHSKQIVSMGGSSRVHTFGSSSTSQPRNNIKQVVQGRTRSLNSAVKGGNSTHESSFGRAKGVVNTMNGSKSIRSGPTSNGENQKTGIATIGTSNGRSFIKHEKPKNGNKTAKKSSPSMTTSAPPRREGFTRKLGGKNPDPNHGMSIRERRLQYLEKQAKNNQ